MKALIYQEPDKIIVAEKNKPILQTSSDAIVKMLKTTICGTDLHIIKGDVPSCSPGRILGHEGIGIIDEIGNSVSSLKKGDLVLISCISSCSKCHYCRRGMYSHCINGGWILGNKIDGTQAEYVRIPHADTSLYKINEEADKDALVMLSDIFPTSFECGVINGKIQPGFCIAIVGAGPIGLATLLTAQLYSPSEIIMIDIDDNRLEVAKRLGATKTINGSDGKTVEKVMNFTNGIGVDTAVEAVGIPNTFILCEDIIAPGGTIANIGVHGVKADLHLERLWSHNISITTRLVDTISLPMLLKTVEHGKINPAVLISHHFKFSNILEGYNTFKNAEKTKALKIIIDFDN